MAHPRADESMKKVLKQLQRSWIAANVAAVNGACLTVKAYGTIAVAHALGTSLNFTVAVLTLKQLGAAFLLSFVWEFITYFTNHPIRLEQEQTERTEVPSPLPPLPPVK